MLHTNITLTKRLLTCYTAFFLVYKFQKAIKYSNNETNFQNNQMIKFRKNFSQTID